MSNWVAKRVAIAAKKYAEWPEEFKEAFRLSTIVDRVPPTLAEGIALLDEVDRLTAELATAREELRNVGKREVRLAELANEQVAQSHAAGVAKGMERALRLIADAPIYHHVCEHPLCAEIKARLMNSIRAASPEPSVCEWTYDDNEYAPKWDSACGEAWCFIDGGPEENRVRYCHGCGKPVRLTST